MDVSGHHLTIIFTATMAWIAGRPIEDLFEEVYGLHRCIPTLIVLIGHCAKPRWLGTREAVLGLPNRCILAWHHQAHTPRAIERAIKEKWPGVFVGFQAKWFTDKTRAPHWCLRRQPNTPKLNTFFKGSPQTLIPFAKVSRQQYIAGWPWAKEASKTPWPLAKVRRRQYIAGWLWNG